MEKKHFIFKYRTETLDISVSQLVTIAKLHFHNYELMRACNCWSDFSICCRRV